MTSPGRSIWIAFIATAASAYGQSAPASPVADPLFMGTLRSALQAYFSTDDAEERRRIGADVARLADGSHRGVADELARLDLWSSRPRPVTGGFSYRGRSGDKTRAAWRLPAGYAPQRAHPTIICFADSGRSAEDTLSQAREILGEPLDGFVVCAVERGLSGSLHQPPGAVEDFHDWVYQLRRRIHTDTNRTYVFGVGRGADAAWMAAIMFPDLFAGAVACFGYPNVPYPVEAYGLLLSNLRNVPALSVWHRADARPARTRTERVAAHNRAIEELARYRSLPITAVSLPPGREGRKLSDVRIGADALDDVLNRRRADAPLVSHWFRYPAAGRVSWLAVSEFRGDLWEAEQISIVASPAIDRSRFITRVVQEKLGYIGGRIRDNDMVVATRRVREIELRLSPDLVDFGRPVRVACNGVKRYEGRLRPSIPVMLESAYDAWDFQRPVWATLRFVVSTDAK